MIDHVLFCHLLISLTHNTYFIRSEFGSRSLFLDMLIHGDTAPFILSIYALSVRLFIGKHPKK